MKIGYFPGCSLESSAREFDESLRAVLGKLGVDLVEVPDWACCGTSSAHNLDHRLALALPARTLALAEAEGFEEVLAPCSACFARLASAHAELSADPALARQVSEDMELPWKGTARVVNILELFERLGDKLDAAVQKPLGRKMACYYGCLLVRPPDVVKFDRPEDPQSMDRVVNRVGGIAVDWDHKTECCGASLAVARTDVVARLCARILDNADKRGAEAIVVACPLCQANLDMRRSEIEREMGRTCSMPVLYITQVVGLALGLSHEELGLHRHLVPATIAPAPPAASAGVPAS